MYNVIPTICGTSNWIVDTTYSRSLKDMSIGWDSTAAGGLSEGNIELVCGLKDRRDSGYLSKPSLVRKLRAQDMNRGKYAIKNLLVGELFIDRLLTRRARRKTLMISFPWASPSFVGHLLPIELFLSKAENFAAYSAYNCFDNTLALHKRQRSPRNGRNGAYNNGRQECQRLQTNINMFSPRRADLRRVGVQIIRAHGLHEKRMGERDGTDDIETA
ncbi:hypothetical protein B0H14DRAFT_2559435 [Mycena olivaceomarginata]|nr:hypothetical protein B0H14DRAFT_2559435 [Mycena olivaceomarginata]